jgi:ETC complex I subunit conserved region
MTARIHRPPNSAMQSGSARSKHWLLEFEPEQGKSIDPLMGYTSSSDMNAQLKLWFDTAEEAIAYAIKKGISYRVEQPKIATRKVAVYSDNFKFTRVGQWTH